MKAPGIMGKKSMNKLLEDWNSWYLGWKLFSLSAISFSTAVLLSPGKLCGAMAVFGCFFLVAAFVKMVKDHG